MSKREIYQDIRVSLEYNCEYDVIPLGQEARCLTLELEADQM
jgi:hypothetical protein